MQWNRCIQLSLAASLLFVVVEIWLQLSSLETNKLWLHDPLEASIGKLSISAESAEEIVKRVEETQEMRKRQLKNYCLQNAGQKLPWNNKNLQNFLVVDDFKIIYCYVPKVACTSWKEALLRMRNNNVTNRLSEIEVHNPKRWRFLSQFNPTDVSNRTATHFKFLFVREPFHRLLSGYKDKFLKNENRDSYKTHRRTIVNFIRPQDVKVAHRDNNNVTFTEFLKFILSNSHPLTHDEHWNQVQQLCHPCAFDFDFIGHFETLEEDAAYILKKEQLGSDSVAIGLTNPSNSSSDFRRFYSEVPREVIYRLGEAFRSDFEMFGYPFPGPLKSLFGNSSEVYD